MSMSYDGHFYELSTISFKRDKQMTRNGDTLTNNGMDSQFIFNMVYVTKSALLHVQPVARLAENSSVGDTQAQVFSTKHVHKLPECTGM